MHWLVNKPPNEKSVIEHVKEELQARSWRITWNQVTLITLSRFKLCYLQTKTKMLEHLSEPMETRAEEQCEFLL